MQMCTVVRMMCCTAFATFFLLGVVSGQTLQISSCLTKDQNLKMSCKFIRATDPNKLPKACYYMTNDKMIGNSNSSSSSTPDPTFKNRATVSISDTTCDLYLTGFAADKTTNFSCFITQNSATVTINATVEKSKLQTCSAWCVVQHSGAALLLAFLTFPLLSELL